MEKVINIILLLLLLGSCIFNVVLVNRLDESINVILETKLTDVNPEIIILDSLVYDTVYIDRYQKVLVPVVNTDTINDTILVVDSIEVNIPIQKKHFSDTLAGTAIFFDLNGFQCEVNNLYVHNFLNVPTQEKAVKINRFGVGLQLGIGVNEKGFTPYIGVGISYNLFSF